MASRNIMTELTTENLNASADAHHLFDTNSLEKCRQLNYKTRIAYTSICLMDRKTKTQTEIQYIQEDSICRTYDYVVSSNGEEDCTQTTVYSIRA